MTIPFLQLRKWNKGTKSIVLERKLQEYLCKRKEESKNHEQTNENSYDKLLTANEYHESTN